jgi:hypothetical protein
MTKGKKTGLCKDVHHNFSEMIFGKLSCFEVIKCTGEWRSHHSPSWLDYRTE